MTNSLWNHDEPISELGVYVPGWIDQDITGSTLAAIMQGGCASGAYMPAVTYWDAKETMAGYGDQVTDFITDELGSLPPPPERAWTWSGMACFYLSTAVELWANSVAEEVEEELAAAQEDKA
jgi:hypothetical protein